MTPIEFRAATDADLEAILAMLVDDDISRGRGVNVERATPSVLAAFAEIQRDDNHQ